MTTIAEDCVYTIVHKDILAEAARKGGPSTFTENKPWVTGFARWQRALKDGLSMAVLLGDATDCSKLIYWGILTKIQIGEEGTNYTVDHLRRFAKQRKPQELVLRKSGKNIAPNFIRPYALCRTPSFIVE